MLSCYELRRGSAVLGVIRFDDKRLDLDVERMVAGCRDGGPVVPPGPARGEVPSAWDGQVEIRRL